MPLRKDGSFRSKANLILKKGLSALLFKIDKIWFVSLDSITESSEVAVATACISNLMERDIGNIWGCSAELAQTHMHADMGENYSIL